MNGGRLNKYVADDQYLLSQWDSIKNEALNPTTIKLGSHKIVSWKCEMSSDHEWEAAVLDRYQGSGCPYCSGRKACHDNCLETNSPELAAEWDFTKNEELTPKDVTCGSSKKVHWKCLEAEDHEWPATVSNRTNGSGCPYCSNRKVCKSNCLATTDPELSKQWHPSKNGDLTPWDVTGGDRKKVFWKCPKGDDHLWPASIRSRTGPVASGCPCCSGRQVCFANCLETKRPDLAEQWHPLKNGARTPRNTTFASGYKAFWICPENPKHNYEMVVANRSLQGQACQYCSGKKVCEDSSLSTTHPRLSEEWCFKRNKAEGIDSTPRSVSFGSNKKVCWQCRNNPLHIWKAPPNNRTVAKSEALEAELVDKVGARCPYCYSWGISINQLRVFCELLILFDNIEISCRDFDKEIDIYLKNYHVAIEVDGFYFHKDLYDKDLEKNKLLKNRKLNVLRFREKGLKRLSKNDIFYPEKTITKLDIDCLVKKLRTLLKSKLNEITNKKLGTYLKLKSFKNEVVFKKYLKGMHKPMQGKSLLDLRPDVAEFWDRNKNNGMSPEDVTPGSGRTYLWQCPKVKAHWWEDTPYQMCRVKQKCRKCFEKNNSLASKFPGIAKHWHPTKNGALKPSDVPFGSKKEVWWKCPKGDDHVWKMSLNSRTNRRSQGCTCCSGRKISKDNSLAENFPEIAAQWHSTKNGKLILEEMTYGSTIRVFWQCPEFKSHVWETSINARTSRNTGCKKCYERNRKKRS